MNTALAWLIGLLVAICLDVVVIGTLGTFWSGWTYLAFAILFGLAAGFFIPALVVELVVN